MNNEEIKIIVPGDILTYVSTKENLLNLFKYIKRLEKENKELKTINEKAIEYIEKNKQIGMFADLRKEGTHQYTIECDVDDLLDILKGE